MADMEPEITRALARAVAYRIFSLAFQTPDDTGHDAIGARDRFVVLDQALSCVGGDSRERVAELDCLRDAGCSLERLDAEYSRVFGHTTRGQVCPCETEYGDDNKFQQPNQLADISGYYLAFGLMPPSASEVRQDHVACECEFMEFLNLKEACLLANATPTAEIDETLAVTRRAQRTFVRDHLGYFGRAFASGLANAGGRYFGAWGRLFLGFLEGECVRLGVEGGPTGLQVRNELSDDTPMACGSTGDVIQIQRRP